MKNFFQFVSTLSWKIITVAALDLFGAAAMAEPPPPQATPAVAAPVTPAAPEEDILDIRGPIHIPAPFPWLAWGSGALAVAGLGFGAGAILRRRRRKLPYEIALENLNKLRSLMQPESAHAFSLAVSEIVRVFIEKCFPVRAAHRTTGEFLHDLANAAASPLAAQREGLGDFLRHCDLAKFARWSLAVPQMEAMLASACGFVIAISKPGAAKKRATARNSGSVQSAAPASAMS